MGEPELELYPFVVLNGTQLYPRFWQIGDGGGGGPPIPGKSESGMGMGRGWTPGARQIGDGPPSPIPGKSGMGMGMGIGGSVPFPQQKPEGKVALT